MKVIHVARKPLIGTVAKNALEHGTGGLNIDKSRIEGVPPSVPQPSFDSPTGLVYGFQTGEGRNGNMSQADGRWPANLILQHKPDCRCVGTKKVRGEGTRKTGGKALGGETTYAQDTSTSGMTRTRWEGLADSDGQETIAAWECVPGCPVATLDEQSGNRPSAGLYPSKVQGPSRLFRHGGLQHQGPLYEDSGGASRFFKQIGPADPEPQELDEPF